MLKTSPVNQEEKQSKNNVNLDLLKLFNLEKREFKHPNDFYIKFRDLFLASENDVSDKIKEVKMDIEKQDFYDPYLFFLKYFEIELEGVKTQCFTKDLFEQSINLSDFLDNLSNLIYIDLHKTLDYKNKNGLNGLSVSSDSIVISNNSNTIRGLFGLEEEAGNILLYNYIRHFIIGRGFNFPKIKEVDNYYGVLLSEYEIKSGIDFIIGYREQEFNPNFPNSKDFIISIIKDFSGFDDGKDLKMNEFSIGNLIGLYLGDIKNSLNIADVRQILIEAYKNKNNFLHYLLSTEGKIISDFIEIINKENINELSSENINKVHELYIALNMERLFSYGYKIIFDTKENSFFISNIDANKASLEKKLKLKTKEQIKIFLGMDESPLIEYKKYFLNTKQEINELYEQEINELCDHNYMLLDDINDPRVDIFMKTMLDLGLTDFEKKNLDVKISKDKLDVILDKYRVKIEKLIEIGGQKYNSLMFGYDKHFRPIGGKIHFKESISSKKKNILEKIYLFSSSPFKLQHADTSMLLAPCESPFQMIEVLKRLHSLKIINDGDIELQLSIAGRLPNDLCGILASNMIFLKNYQTEYQKEAFHTGSWDNLTKSCIICYDAGVLEKEGFSNIPEEIAGRTDILGLRRIEEVLIFSIVSNLISQSHFGGVHQELGLDFIKEYRCLLEKYNISNILDGKWVHNPDDKDKESDLKDYSNHYELVKTCTDLLNEGIAKYNDNGDSSSIIFELRDLLGKYILRGNLLNPENQKLLS
ncbi:MAG: hypothetical protein PHG82_05580 [Candidatus Gracilibacteria bacterium]|nr:hypothetical protein [Candidatus Gracilibacteria bacterium]